MKFPVRSSTARAAWLAACLVFAPRALAQERAAEVERLPPPIRLAVVNGAELTFDVAYETFLASHTGHGVLVRGDAAVRDLAGRLVERELFLMEAETLGVPSEREVLEVLAAYQGQVAADEFWKREVQDKVQVTDADVEAFYEKTDVALALTLIVTSDRASAEALRARVVAGEDMAKLARTESIHESRNFDGQLTLVRRGELYRALEEPAFRLTDAGSLTDVVDIETGFAFARLDQRSINPDRPPRDKAIPQIRGILIERAQKKLASEVDERVLKAVEIWIDEAALARSNVVEGKDGTAIVARAAGETLSLAELREGLDLEKLRAIGDDDDGADAGTRLAKQWTRGRALVAAAKAAGLFEAPEVKRKVLSFRRDVIMKTLCDNYVWPDTDPSAADVKRYYEERQATEFTSPLEVRLAYIVVPAEDAGRAVMARLKGGEEFEKLAREVSTDKASAMHGGRVGWVKPKELLPALETAVAALAVGATDGPIVTSEGTFILRALDRREPQVIPFAQARNAAERSIVKTRRQEAYATWASALRDRADVTLDEAGLAQAVAWLDAEAARRAEEQAKLPQAAAGEKPAGHDAAAAPPPRAKPEGDRP